MAETGELGLGCMGMNFENEERSVETVRYALDHGVTLLNTGEFYSGGESEMVLREALKGVPRDSYRLHVKFGVLPRPTGGIYGLDVRPFNVRAHLAYSMHRLGVDHIDIYEPARMDESVPVEELVGELGDLVDEGLIGSIALTQVTADQLRRASKVRPISVVEQDYSLANRSAEQDGLLDAVHESGAQFLAFGVVGHGLLTGKGTEMLARRGVPADGLQQMTDGLGKIAADLGISVNTLAQAYVRAKHPEMNVLIGTTSPEHLQDAVDARKVELTADDVARIEAAFPAGATRGLGMRQITFRDGRVVDVRHP